MSISSATVKIITKSQIKAKINTKNGAIESSAPVTLINSSGGNINRLDELTDVVEISPPDGSSLVYRSVDDKYVVQQLTFDNVTGNLDCGLF